MLSRHQQTPSVTDPALSIPTIMLTPPELRWFRERFLRNLVALRARTGGILENAQARYERYFEKSIRVSPRLLPGQYVFLDRPPEQRTPAACFENELRSKLVSKTVQRFWIVSTTPDTVTVGEDGIHNSVSLNRVTRAPAEIAATDETTKLPSRKMRETPPTRLSGNDGTEEEE